MDRWVRAAHVEVLQLCPPKPDTQLRREIRRSGPNPDALSRLLLNDDNFDFRDTPSDYIKRLGRGPRDID